MREDSHSRTGKNVVDYEQPDSVYIREESRSEDGGRTLVEQQFLPVIIDGLLRVPILLRLEHRCQRRNVLIF